MGFEGLVRMSCSEQHVNCKSSIYMGFCRWPGHRLLSKLPIHGVGPAASSSRVTQRRSSSLGRKTRVGNLGRALRDALAGRSAIEELLEGSASCPLSGAAQRGGKSRERPEPNRQVAFYGSLRFGVAGLCVSQGK